MTLLLLITVAVETAIVRVTVMTCLHLHQTATVVQVQHARTAATTPANTTPHIRATLLT
jgi:hypothetical protein